MEREAKGLNEVATKTIDQAAGRLTHASIGQPDWEPHPGEWPLAEIASVFCFSLRDFVMQLERANPERAAMFGDRPTDVANAIAGHLPGFTRTPVSDHPEVADLTRSLQSFIGFE